MKYLFLLVLINGILASCTRGEGTNNLSIGYNGADSLKKSIELKENNLKNYYQAIMQDQLTIDTLPNKLINELIKDYQIYYRSYPKDSLSPYFVDKIHQLFTQEKQYTYAADWVDTLLNYYPNYSNKSLVLYSAATSVDMYLLDTNRAKVYYLRLLEECPKLKTEVKNQINHRLRYLDIPYMKYLSDYNTLK